MGFWCWLAITLHPGREYFGKKKKMLEFLLCMKRWKRLSLKQSRSISIFPIIMTWISTINLKVCKPYDVINKNLQQFGFLYTHYSIDEQMVPHTGKNSSKQTVRTKRIRFGCKIFVMYLDHLYAYFVDPNCGKKVWRSQRIKIFFRSFSFW